MTGNGKKTMRLDQLLSAQNVGSRKDVSKWIRNGAASVNGLKVRSPEHKVCPDIDVVCFKGQEIVYRQYLYIMMNKPAGVLSASRDKKKPYRAGPCPFTAEPARAFSGRETGQGYDRAAHHHR